MNDRLTAIAATVTARWRWHPDYEDLRQVALLAAWQAGDVPTSHAGADARRAVTDELRRLGGRPGTLRYVTRLDLFGSVPDVFDRVADVAPSLLYGLEGRQAVLADALSTGAKKHEVAEMFGVSPSAVSHSLHALRRAISATLETS
jgi:DNA-directed RNA polymerase specialized sigma24 family protein